MDPVSNYPYMMKKWSKNNVLSPDKVSAGSNTKILWHCDKGHDWEARALNVKHGSGCSICANKLLLVGFNDLATRYPDLIPIYKEEINGDPSRVLVNYNAVFTWRCLDGNHDYMAKLGAVAQGRRCPYCAGKQVLAGFNDLATVYPALSKMWDYAKNDTTPYEISGNSHSKVWWTCGIPGHSFILSVNAMKGTPTCRVCKRTFLSPGVNDLLSTYPELVKWWDWDKNIEDPREILGSTKNKMWARCDEGHSWYANINHVRKLTECSVCIGLVVIAGVNDLATERPDLLAMWDWDENAIDPTTIRPGSTYLAHWVCSLGHRWEEQPFHLSPKQRPCPYCGNRKVFSGFNDLKTKLPEINKVWSKKNKKAPDAILAGSLLTEIVIDCPRSGEDFCVTAYRYSTYPICRCSLCSTERCSGLEMRIREALETIIGKPGVYGDRSIIAPYELDIYYPNLNLAVECNGVYWHSNEVILKSRGVSAEEYHAMKAERCAELGINLLFVWEDDWILDAPNILNGFKEFIDHGKIPECFAILDKG